MLDYYNSKSLVSEVKIALSLYSRIIFDKACSQEKSEGKLTGSGRLFYCNEFTSKIRVSIPPFRPKLFLFHSIIHIQSCSAWFVTQGSMEPLQSCLHVIVSRALSNERETYTYISILCFATATIIRTPQNTAQLRSAQFNHWQNPSSSHLLRKRNQINTLPPPDFYHTQCHYLITRNVVTIAPHSRARDPNCFIYDNKAEVIAGNPPPTTPP